MSDPQSHISDTEHPGELRPLAGAFDLLSDDAVGYCSGGVCHLPARDEVTAPEAP